MIMISIKSLNFFANELFIQNSIYSLLLHMRSVPCTNLHAFLSPRPDFCRFLKFLKCV